LASPIKISSPKTAEAHLEEMEAALPALGRRRRIVRADRRGRRQAAALLHAKSGSLSPLKHFAYDMREIVRRQRLPGRAVRLTQRSKTSWALSSVAAGVADFRVPKLPCARNGVDPHVETIRPSKSIPKQLMPAWFVCITSSAILKFESYYAVLSSL
jgi:hypothetical protein